MLSIRQNDDPVLREVASEVPTSLFGTPELKKEVEEMIDTLDKQRDGVALAAPQVGISKRIFVVRYDRMTNSGQDDPSGPRTDVYINPKFINSSKRRVEMPEGCLSVRGLYGTTLRHEKVTVAAQDANGKWFTRGAGGILAQAFQHETDHLEGILFTDHAFDLYERGEKEPDKGTDDTEQS